MRGKKAKALRRLAEMATQGKFTRYKVPPTAMAIGRPPTCMLDDTCGRKIYRSMKSQAKAFRIPLRNLRLSGVKS